MKYNMPVQSSIEKSCCHRISVINPVCAKIYNMWLLAANPHRHSLMSWGIKDQHGVLEVVGQQAEMPPRHCRVLQTPSPSLSSSILQCLLLHFHPQVPLSFESRQKPSQTRVLNEKPAAKRQAEGMWLHENVTGERCICTDHDLWYTSIEGCVGAVLVCAGFCLQCSWLWRRPRKELSTTRVSAAQLHHVSLWKKVFMRSLCIAV